MWLKKNEQNCWILIDLRMWVRFFAGFRRGVAAAVMRCVWSFPCLAVCFCLCTMCVSCVEGSKEALPTLTNTCRETEIDIFQISRLFSEARTDDIILITASKIKHTTRLYWHTYKCAQCLYICVSLYSVRKKSVEQRKKYCLFFFLFARTLSTKFMDISNKMHPLY